MRQIRDLVRFLAKIFLNKDVAIYQLPDTGEYTDTDYLYKELLFLLNQGKINDSDDYLKKNDFTRKEIEEGLKELTEKFGWEIF